MGIEVPSKRRLFALEGACGRELIATAQNLLQSIWGRGLEARTSYWDASETFAQLRLDDPNIAGPSPRALLLLFAADLAFRLRWEIQPALEKGQYVIATPYVQTAIGFGKAAGVPRRWMLKLFGFAVKPDASYLTHPGRLVENCSGGRSDGYFEFCRIALQSNRLHFDSEALGLRFQAYLDTQERLRHCQTLTPQLLTGSFLDLQP